MYKQAYILSNNAPLFEFMSRKLTEACGIQASVFPTELAADLGKFLILFDHTLFDCFTLNEKLIDFHHRFPHADLVVFGEEDDHVNQSFVLHGAKDFLNARMMTSPAFVKYLQVRMKRDWLGEA